jgi:small neutral amino acid transporter SnatA (MarC family)
VSRVFELNFWQVWQVFVTLLVIMDPPGVVPPFLGLTRGLPDRVRNRHAWQAAVVGLGVILGFAVFGQAILAYLGVELPALQGAGGLLLLLVASGTAAQRRGTAHPHRRPAALGDRGPARRRRGKSVRYKRLTREETTWMHG